MRRSIRRKLFFCIIFSHLAVPTCQAQCNHDFFLDQVQVYAFFVLSLPGKKFNQYIVCLCSITAREIQFFWSIKSSEGAEVEIYFYHIFGQITANGVSDIWISWIKKNMWHTPVRKDKFADLWGFFWFVLILTI